MNKTFGIFKNKRKVAGDSKPDYNISMKVGDKYIDIGGAWLKEAKDGSKFFSCKLSNAYGERKGYQVVEDSVSTLTEEEKAKIQALKAGEQTKKEVVNDINPDSIPF